MQKILSGIFISVLMGTSAMGQALPPAPSAVLMPPVSPPAAAAPPPVRESTRPSIAKPATGRIRAIAVTGARAIPKAAIAKEFSVLIGKRASIAGLRAALDRVNKRYADAGYALCRAAIPAQTMRGGVLTVRVREGYIDKVTVRGDAPRLRETIARYAARLTAMRPLRTAALDRFLRLVADIPGVKVSAGLTKMDPRTGAVHLVLTATYHPFSTALALAPGTVQSLPVLPYVTLGANNLLGDADRFALTALASPRPKDEYFFQFAGSAALGKNGWRIATTDFTAKARANGLPPGIDLSATQWHGELQLSDPLIETGLERMTLTGGGYFARMGYDLNHRGIARDRYFAGYLQWSDHRQVSARFSRMLSLRATGGFALADALSRSRANATTDFARLGADAALYYAPDAAFGILLRADGQLASGSLMAGEEVVYGGARFGRGYDSGVLSGDAGLGLSLQPQYGFALAPDWRVTTYAFGDYAHVANTRGDRQGNATLASAGIGFDVTHGAYSAGLGIAQPLKSFSGYRYKLTPRLFGTLQAQL
jgi:hemolysin activation/secretion protein